MRRYERGASMVEFAIASMVMLVLIFGIMEFAQLMYAYHTVAGAARLGTRWAVVRGTDCLDSTCPATAAKIKTYVLTQVPLLDTSTVTVNSTWANSSVCTAAGKNAPGCTVSVTVTYPFTFSVGFVWNGTMSLTSTSTMVISE